jgi:UDP-N-acetylmuramate--alanine ligase
VSECLVITTGAHKGFDNPQVLFAKEKNITVLTQGQALAHFMSGALLGGKDLQAIAVAGSHGKTTVSSLLATTMKALGLEPSYAVGTGEVFPLGAPGHYGAGNYFVAEADEYVSEPSKDRTPKFLYQNPTFAIFNNIDFDHPDQFGDIDDVVDAFLEFAHNIQSGGKLFVNGDDKYLKDFRERVNKDIRVVTYGTGKENDYVISKIVAHGLSSQFTVSKKGVELGVFELQVPGVHNAKNALSVVAFLLELGFSPSQVRVCLNAFTGTKRRSEIVGHTKNGAILIDDYGHHPLEISTTIDAIKQAYPDKKLICVFQPHTFSRTKALLSDFGQAFTKAEKLLLLPVFKSLRDTEHDTLSQEEYVNAHVQNVDTQFLETFDDVVEYIDKNYASDEYIVLTIGAGDVYKIAYRLKNQ